MAKCTVGGVLSWPACWIVAVADSASAGLSVGTAGSSRDAPTGAWTEQDLRAGSLFAAVEFSACSNQRLSSIVGILLGWFSPLSNMDAWFNEATPVHIVYAAAMCGIVSGTTLCVGLSYGSVLRNAKAALAMAFATSLAAVLALLLTIIVFDQFDIRVGGTAPFAMSKVTTMSLLAAAISGGAVLGVTFSRFAGTASPGTG